MVVCVSVLLLFLLLLLLLSLIIIPSLAFVTHVHQAFGRCAQMRASTDRGKRITTLYLVEQQAWRGVLFLFLFLFTSS